MDPRTKRGDRGSRSPRVSSVDGNQERVPVRVIFSSSGKRFKRRTNEKFSTLRAKSPHGIGPWVHAWGETSVPMLSMKPDGASGGPSDPYARPAGSAQSRVR